MAKQRLNHSCYLDTYGEQRLFASLRAVEFAEQIGAMFGEDTVDGHV